VKHTSTSLPGQARSKHTGTAWRAVYERMGLPLIAAALFCALLAIPAAQAQPITVKHAKGEITLTATPKTVLVLDVPSLDTLDALGVDVAGVPGGNLVPYLTQYQADRYRKIGTLFEPDLAAIQAAKPDLIIIGGRSASKYEDLAPLGPTIDLSVDSQRYLDSARENIETLGRIFGKTREAAQLVTTLDEKATALKAVAKDAGTLVMLIANAGRVGVYGAGARTNWLYRDIGFAAVALSSTPPKPDATQEERAAASAAVFAEAMQKNPDWLFVVDRSAAIGQGTAENAAARVLGENDLVRQTSAWKNRKVVYLLPQEAYIVGSGYQALTRLMDQVQQAVSANP